MLLSKDYVYTWHIWQHWCNIASYRLQLSSFFSVDLCQFSEGQPMQIMAKDSKVRHRSRSSYRNSYSHRFFAPMKGCDKRREE